jgi:hypothetical protein
MFVVERAGPVEQELRTVLTQFARENQMRIGSEYFDTGLGHEFVYYLRSPRVHIFADNKAEFVPGMRDPQPNGLPNVRFEQNRATIALYRSRGHSGAPVEGAARKLVEALNKRGGFIVEPARPSAPTDQLLRPVG